MMHPPYKGISRQSLIALALALVNYGTASAAPVIDQEQLVYNGGTSARTLPGHTVWQSFTAGLTGTLVEIDMGFFNDMSGQGRLDILAGEGTGGQILQTLIVPVVGITQPGVTWNNWTVDVPVTSGSLYTFRLTPDAATLPDPYGVAIGAGNPYPRGVFGLDDPSGSYPTSFDAVFRTWVDTSVTSIPDFLGSTKDVTPRTGVVTGDALNYTLVVTNSGTGPANQVSVTDVLPSCVSVPTNPPWDPATAVTVVPDTSAARSYDELTRSLTVSFAAIAAAPAAGSSQTITITGLEAGPDTVICCNQASIGSDEVPLTVNTTDPLQPGPEAPTCVSIGVPPTSDFGVRTKQVSAVTPPSGTAISYTLVFRNTGTTAATGAVVNDRIPDCLTVPPTWDPATEVTVSPDSGASRIYTAATRTLSVSFSASIPVWAAAGAEQTITIGGLLAGAVGVECCNQAAISATDIPLPGQSTADPDHPRPDDMTCITPTATPLSTNLLRNDEIASLAPLSPPLAAIFTGVPPGCTNNGDPTVTLQPSEVGPTPICTRSDGEATLGANGSGDGDDLYVLSLPPAPFTEPEAGLVWSSTRPLVYYQIENPTQANRLKLVKSVLLPADGSIDFDYR